MPQTILAFQSLGNLHCFSPFLNSSFHSNCRPALSPLTSPISFLIRSPPPPRSHLLLSQNRTETLHPAPVYKALLGRVRVCEATPVKPLLLSTNNAFTDRNSVVISFLSLL